MKLEVRIKKNFKDFTLDTAFDFDSGILGILGASGCGKSMTLKCIAGIETPDAGRIVVNGRVLFDADASVNIKPQQRKVGYLFQNYALFPHMTVEENIGCGLPGEKSDKREAIQALLHRCQLDGLGRRYPAQLSGGQQQRVALARILAYEPTVLLLDEPFSALDSFLKDKLQLDMLELLADYKGYIIMVSHNRDEVYRFCPQLLVMEEGKVLRIDDTRAMFRDPQKLKVAQLTGCKNVSRARRVADDMVLALDWGCQLKVAAPIPADFSHVGMRAHDFMVATGREDNVLPLHVISRAEAPFEWNILFTCNQYRATEGTRLWWKVSKEHDCGELPAALTIDPAKVLLLTEH